jgi:hypothetical protein
MAKPEKLRIAFEDFDGARFDRVGRLPDGTQFMAFVTGAFPTGEKYCLGDDWRRKKKWLAVVHRFDADGNHIGTVSRLGGYDIEGWGVYSDKAFSRLRELLVELAVSGPPQLCDIWIRPFAIEIDGVTHGLFYELSEEEPEPSEERGEWVMLEPWDIMFHPPWDSSEYSS